MVYFPELFWCFSSLAVPELPISSAFCWLLRVRTTCRVIDLYLTGLMETRATFGLLILKVLILTGSKIHIVMSTGQAGAGARGKRRRTWFWTHLPCPARLWNGSNVSLTSAKCWLFHFNKQVHKWGKFCFLTHFVMKGSHIFVWNKSMTPINTSWSLAYTFYI